MHINVPQNCYAWGHFDIDQASGFDNILHAIRASSGYETGFLFKSLKYQASCLHQPLVYSDKTLTQCFWS